MFYIYNHQSHSYLTTYVSDIYITFLISLKYICPLELHFLNGIVLFVT